MLRLAEAHLASYSEDTSNFTGVKWPEHTADHSFPSSPKVTNVHPIYAITVWVLSTGALFSLGTIASL
jgi:hypothetical protein